MANGGGKLCPRPFESPKANSGVMTLSLKFIVVFSYILLYIHPIYSQVSAPNCTKTGFDWSSNSLGQNPCLIAAYLLAACNNGSFSITALHSGNSYTGPDGPDNSNSCKCNTVVYCLISACDACQGNPWISWPEWSFNCTTKASEGTFPEAIPAGTRVPHWAFQNSIPGGNWNLSMAQDASDSPEITGTASIFPISTASPSAGTSTSTSSKGKLVITGGVVGGIVAASLIGGVVAWFVIRRRRTCSHPSPVVKGDKSREIGESAEPRPPLYIPLKIYDPSDPSTYPPQTLSSTNHTTDHHDSNSSQGSQSNLQPNRIAYSGLPEI
ncbi:hypothetical protein BGW80DRAFT_303466 [Lactifluus volemus]|nr:hypothetical protein BGW80DRAFT_303466 [Lactifluus volemus]